MSHTQSFNASLLEVMISSKNEPVFIRDLSNLTLEISFNAWWASMNVGSKQPIAWNNSRHASSRRFYYVTSQIGKHLFTKAHIAMLNELTELDVTELTSSTVDETTLAILKRQGSRGITLLTLQKKMIFDIQFNPY